MDNRVPVAANGTFVVRNDKYRGMLIESLQTEDGVVHFFKFHQQPVDRHCDSIQNIIKTANVKTTRRLNIDLSEFVHDYYRAADNSVQFKTIKLNSTHEQLKKVQQMMINKKNGMMKRAATIAKNKPLKIAEKNKKMLERMAQFEEKFKRERAERMKALLEATQQATQQTEPIESQHTQ